MRIHCLQHVAEEGPGSIEAWAQKNNHSLEYCRLFAKEPLPQLDDFDLLLVMGGPMSVNDDEKFSWLRPEIQLIHSAIQAQKLVLGICLGAQLIAKSLGAVVFPNPEKEIGWFPIRLTEGAKSSRLFGFLPQEITVFHWHGETFTLPADSVLLASSAACRHQAFSYGKHEHVLALQFHCEITPEIIKNIEPDAILKDRNYIQSRDTILSQQYRSTETHHIMSGLLDRLARPPYATLPPNDKLHKA